MNTETLNIILVTDCGSTTTKALLFERTPQGWRKTSRGEAPTTVEAPVADVTVGARNAFLEIQELSGRTLLDGENPISPFLKRSDDRAQGIDLYLSTSSAGGGLQMIVAGAARDITSRAAQRAALGAGAIVLDVISADDGRDDIAYIERVRSLKPDIVLLTGGIDSGSTQHVMEAAEILLAAAPRPRFGDTLQLPVIYAGNQKCALEVQKLLSSFANVQIVPNIQPTLDEERLGPAREAIHELFLTHVMSHSPGYDMLLKWTPVPIMPTPTAVGDIVRNHADRNNLEVLAVDIGGATTDVFSVHKNQNKESVYNRTVSANLGMSYSVANVLIEAGAENISRWLPYKISDQDLRDRLRNKMIRPTSIPQTKEDLWLEQAVCREALRLSLIHHRSLVGADRGSQRTRGIADIFSQNEESSGLSLMDLDLVIGSGGVLSHAPQRLSAALMLLEGFGLEGVTEIAVDSIFMMPHLGVLSQVYPEAAQEIFIHDCLISICHTIVPVYQSKIKKKEIARVFFNETECVRVEAGKVRHCKELAGQSGLLRVEPMHGSVNVGAGYGKSVERSVVFGSEGLLLDGRNRPFVMTDSERAFSFAALYKELGLG